MSTDERLRVQRIAVTTHDSAAAVAQLRAQVDAAGEEPAALIFFCSPRYDLADLGQRLHDGFRCPLVGCTTAGMIGPLGFQADGLTAVAIYSKELSVRSYLIAPLSDGPQARAAAVGAEVVRDRAASTGRAFGLLLIDGLSMVEEGVAATLHQAMHGIPLVGGSAGDDLEFSRCHVYHDGVFRRDAATLAVVETTLRFAPFKFHDLGASERRVVVTRADPARRRVYEIDGLPAAEAYGESLGLLPEQLGRDVFSRHPLMLRTGNDYYVRSIRQIEPDGSMTLYCAIDEGVVLTIGTGGGDPLARARNALAAADSRVNGAKLMISCDCVLRRLAFEQASVAGELGALYASHNLVGFSTYGEQYNGLHINQTLTGVALGE